MNTLSETSACIRLKPKKAELTPAFSRFVPVKTPVGDIVEPTIQLGNTECFEIDLNRVSEEQIGAIAYLYSGSRIPAKLAEFFSIKGLLLIPRAWVSAA